MYHEMIILFHLSSESHFKSEFFFLCPCSGPKIGQIKSCILVFNLQGFGYKEEEKGYYAGIVASAMFAGRAFGRYTYCVGKR